MIKRICYVNHELSELKLFIQRSIEVQKQVYDKSDDHWEYIQWSDEYINPCLEEYSNQHDLLIRFIFYELNTICERYLDALRFEYYFRHLKEDKSYSSFLHSNEISLIDRDELLKKLRKEKSIKEFFNLKDENPLWEEMKVIREYANAYKHRNGRKKLRIEDLSLLGKQYNPTIEQTMSLVESSKTFFKKSFERLGI